MEIWDGIKFAIGIFIGIAIVLFICGFIGVVVEEYRNIKKENERRKNARNRKHKTLSK